MTDTHVSRVRMTGISKRYGALQSLDNASLDLKPGEVLGLVGDNGAGKSTMSKVLSGAVIPDTGTIEIEVRLIDELRRGQRAVGGVDAGRACRESKVAGQRVRKERVITNVRNPEYPDNA